MTIDRREFLRRAAIIAGGAIAADQMELIERLTHNKVYASPFPRSLGEIHLLDGTGRTWRRIPYNGEKLNLALENYERTQWMRVVLDKPNGATALHNIGLDWMHLMGSSGGTFTLPYDMSAPDPARIKSLFDLRGKKLSRV